MKVFSYGSLMLNENQERFCATIICSAFIVGYKLVVEKSPITKTNYHYIKIVNTGCEKDIVCGFILDVKKISEVDRWEGDSYKRVKIDAFDRRTNKIKCNVYIKKQMP